MLRSEVREEIFKILFRMPFLESGEMMEQIDFSMEELESKSEKNRSYIREKTMAVLSHMEEVDRKLSECCEGWNLNRLGKAELAIMRIAVYEILLDPEIDTRIAINEALELSKRYCDEQAKGFINGVLRKVADSCAAGQTDDIADQPETVSEQAQTAAE